MHRISSASSLFLLAAVAGAAAGCAVENGAEPAPLLSSSAQLLRVEGAVAGEYIVVLRGDDASVKTEAAATVSAELAGSVGAEVLFIYQHSIKGFAARMSEADAKRLLADPRVAYISENGVVQALATQLNPPWGLDRIDQRNLPLNASYTFSTTGTNVHAYVIDTGIYLAHTQFTGRIGAGFAAAGLPAAPTGDCNGHGTHLAGIIGGTTYGVAKGVILHPVRVLGCTGSGTIAGVISGVDWVTANRIRPAVANMSLGGAASVAVDDAVNRSISAGVTYAVAAGGSATSSCNTSPARVPAALTVGASTMTDTVSSSSNQGACLDLFAPGQNILSSWYTSNSATATLSGTSMATAHVTGVAARYLQTAPNDSPAQVAAFINGTATLNVLSGVNPPAPNRLLYIAP
jgi:subtilisin family serine protease